MGFIGTRKRAVTEGPEPYEEQKKGMHIETNFYDYFILRNKVIARLVEIAFYVLILHSKLSIPTCTFPSDKPYKTHKSLYLRSRFHYYISEFSMVLVSMKKNMKLDIFRHNKIQND